MNKREVLRRRSKARQAVLKALDQEARNRRDRERAAAATASGTATPPPADQP
jgi:hypothetical protein